MSEILLSSKLDRVYAHLWAAHGDGAYAELDQSLNPRPPEMLYEYVKELNLAPHSNVLDVGSGLGNHTCELAERFDFQVTGVEPVERNIKVAEHFAKQRGLAGKTKFVKGTMEAIPADDASFDFVWCRDVLVHVVNADKAFKECTRVLQPGSHCLVFSTFATDRMEPKEQARLFDALGIVEENMAPQRLEARMMDAGFEIKSVDSIGSELIQYYEEKDHRCSTELMRYARMTQKKERFRLLLGEEAFEAAAALYQWMVYQLLGKLSSSIYLLKKP